MDAGSRESLEREIRERAGRGDVDGAVTALLRGFGPEVLGFLHATHRDETDASEVFSIFAEDAWRGLAGFRWESSLRTWLYALARNASFHHRRRTRKRGDRERALGSDIVAGVVDAVRTETLAYLRTEVKDRFAAVREELEDEDRELLVLRVDRKMAWTDLARVLGGDEPPLAGEALKREAARLRKRYKLLKDRLHARARAEGWIAPGDEDA